MISQQRLAEIVWSKITVSADDECWDWIGYKNRQGYGRVYWQKKIRPATHMVWLLIHGRIPCRYPDGEVVAHKCDNPSCCNPLHLFLTNQSGNMKDAANKKRLWMQARPGIAAGPSLKNKLKTHCVNGHPLSGDNLRVVGKRKMRRCVECFRARDRERKRALRAAEKVKNDFTITA